MGLMDGKVGLVVGIANDRSYAWHIANSLIAHGATCAYTCLPGEKNERRTRRAAEKIEGQDPGTMWLKELDAGSDEQLDAVFDAYGKDHDRMDFLIHSIAFADREWLQPGKFATTPREAYLSAIDISAYTLSAMAGRAKDIMARTSADTPGGSSIISMSYYGAEKVVPGYNVMGVAKAALETTNLYLASELGEYNIRANCISGGYLRTLASSAVGGTDSMDEHAQMRAPLRRGVLGSDVGGTAVYLCSELAAGVTGETIYVDCGVSTIGV